MAYVKLTAGSGAHPTISVLNKGGHHVTSEFGQ